MSYLAPVFEPVGSSHSSPLHDLHSKRSASPSSKVLNLSVPGFNGMAPNVTGYERKNDGPDWDSNPGPLYLYSGALPTKLSGAGYCKSF